MRISDWSSDVCSSDLASPSGLRTLRRSLRLPSLGHLRGWHMPQGIGWGVLIANCLAQSLLAVWVVASLYARYLPPEYRVPPSQLSALLHAIGRASCRERAWQDV